MSGEQTRIPIGGWQTGAKVPRKVVVTDRFVKYQQLDLGPAGTHERA